MQHYNNSMQNDALNQMTMNLNMFYPPPMPHLAAHHQYSMATTSSGNAALPPQAPPTPPDDIEQKNIIDKLANFVARNGAEFENVTKLKQKDNPKFRFLYGEQYFDYYTYKVGVERDMIHFQQHQQQQQQQQQQQMLQQPSYAHPPADFSMPPMINLAESITALQAKIDTLKSQINESETNLNAQNEVFKIKKKVGSRIYAFN